MTQQKSNDQALDLLAEGLRAIADCRAEKLPDGWCFQHLLDEMLSDVEQFLTERKLPPFKYGQTPRHHDLLHAACILRDGNGPDAAYVPFLEAAFELTFAMRDAGECMENEEMSGDATTSDDSYQLLQSRVGSIYRSLSQFE